MLERCVLNEIQHYLLCHISQGQHRFIPGKSCVTQLVEVLHRIGSQLDSGKQTDVIYQDMSKAFDKVNHAILIEKLRSFNIDGNLLKWFGSYLQNRRQRVTVLGATSTQLHVTSGFPQGLMLEPMLFLLYVNDLIEGVIKVSNVASFADDIQIYKSIESLSDAVPLQADLRSLESRAEASGLVLSEDKCSCQRISRRKTPLLFSYSVKNQGPTIYHPKKMTLASGWQAI